MLDISGEVFDDLTALRATEGRNRRGTKSMIDLATKKGLMVKVVKCEI